MNPDPTRTALAELKALLSARVSLNRLILFGSRARGDAGPASDVDVVVIVDGPLDEAIEDQVSDAAWQIGFDYGLVIVPVVFARSEWEDGPERHSLLAQAVSNEGIAI